ncbi:hypothetical protein HYZ82_01470 [Candidatus Nomurabacteria bacterium]|nr:hypothetical protein [Candidatus Nomurabacteria bacterium]
MPPEVKIPNNAEIDQALKEFEMKSVATVTPQASTAQTAISLSDGRPKMIRWVMKLSGGKLGEQQAQYVLLGFVIAVIGISLFLFFNSSSQTSSGKALPYEETYKPQTLSQ